MKNARYIRQSTSQQSNMRQLAIAHPDEKLFIDIVSGSVPFNERPQGMKLIEAVEAGVREDEYGDLPLDKPLDRRAVQRTPQSLQQKDTEVKGQAYIEALRLVKEDNGRAFTALLGTPIGIEVADLYKANEAKGDQNNEELLSYLAKEFPSSADQKKAAQVIFGLDITKIESEYMGKDEESPLKPLYSQARLDIGSTVEAPDVPEEPVDTAPIGD